METLKRIAILILAIGLGIGMYFLITEINANNEATKKVESFKTAFMEGCNSDGEARDYCECAWNDLRQNLGDRALADLIETGDIASNPKALDSAYQCMGLL